MYWINVKDRAKIVLFVAISLQIMRHCQKESTEADREKNVELLELKKED